jgi:hypothetical protein
MKFNAIWTVVVGIAALALPAAARIGGVPANAGPIEFRVFVDNVREVPVGNPLPGMHLDVKVDGHALDVYVAPMDFCTKFDIKVRKGDEVEVQGIRVEPQPGEATVVLAKEITTGQRDVRSGVFHATLTVFLRNDDGPFFDEPKPVAPKPSAEPLTGR